jgi:hypothetical protein
MRGIRPRGGFVSRVRAVDDFQAIRLRMEELRREWVGSPDPAGEESAAARRPHHVASGGNRRRAWFSVRRGTAPGNDRAPSQNTCGIKVLKRRSDG